MTIAHPLQWPAGQPRTKSPARSRFDVPFSTARQELLWEVERHGGRYPVISTNIETRRDGLPYASATEPADPGVAVYFMDRAGRQMVFACDRWDRVRDNMRAIHKTLDAIRGMDRWGVAQASDRAFSGFAQIEGAGDCRWWVVLGVPADATEDQVKEAYRAAIREARAAGDEEREKALNVARDEAAKR